MALTSRNYRRKMPIMDIRIQGSLKHLIMVKWFLGVVIQCSITNGQWTKLASSFSHIILLFNLHFYLKMMEGVL